jgi:hypothetical protein
MSNLESAKKALEAELQLAKQGYAFYQSRIDALGKALGELEILQGGGAVKGVATKGKRGRKPGRPAGKVASKAASKAAPKAAKSTEKKTRGRKAGGGNDLPFTGGDYWPNLVTSEPQSGADILHAAINKLGFTPTKQHVQKLTNRATFALHSLVKSGKIQDSGSGRERRFFKA